MFSFHQIILHSISRKSNQQLFMILVNFVSHEDVLELIIKEGENE